MPPSDSRDRAALRRADDSRRSAFRALNEPMTNSTSRASSGEKVPSTATVMPDVLVGAGGVPREQPPAIKRLSRNPVGRAQGLDRRRHAHERELVEHQNVDVEHSLNVQGTSRFV